MSAQPVTLEDSRYKEDLAQLAATQFRVAERLCDHCRTFHAMWPYRRLARVVASADAGAPGFESALSALLEAGRRRVLIAGAGDTGLLALTARAGATHNVEIVVLDRCRTPLELCRQFAERWALRADTLHLDLTRLDITAAFDIVFANSILLFIAPERRVDVLSRLCRALRPNGRLINVFNTGRRIALEGAEPMLAALERRGVPLPEPAAAFVERLAQYLREFDSRESALNELDQVLALHERAGFKLLSCVETDMGVTSPWQHAVAKHALRRHLIVAEPMPLR